MKKSATHGLSEDRFLNGAALDSTHNDLNCTTVLVGPFEAGIATEKSSGRTIFFLIQLGPLTAEYPTRPCAWLYLLQSYKRGTVGSLSHRNLGICTLLLRR